ncbi:hypothetical protein HYW17_01685 [Candidatus Uhrbacteria bacterium]|nr:hypothetical protein [Candidatus Uhrbacteria bacterium]
MPAIDMTEIYRKYPGLWVALTEENKVVAAGEDGKKVFEEAQKKVERPILYHVPAHAGFFIG